MALNLNGFVFNVDPLIEALFDAFHDDCVNLTVGIGNSVPVRVRVTVRQEVTVQQSTSNTVPSAVVTVQQATVSVPQQNGVVNPAQQHQSQGAGQEIVVGQVPVQGNRALEGLAEENSIQDSVGTTLLLPQKANNLAGKTIQSLGKEVAAVAAANKQLAEEAAQAATSTIDDAARLAGKLKQLSSAAQQQLLQKANLPFDVARNIANLSNADEVAAILRQQGFAKIAEINRNVTHQAQRVAASLC